MRLLLFASAAAALALTATNARADEVEYLNEHAVLAASSSSEPIVTPDVTYPGPHAVMLKDSPGPGRSVVAAYDDVRYDEGSSLPASAAPARDDHAACRVARQDMRCPYHG